MATIQVDLPEELLQAARISAQPSMSASASREVAKLLALELFCKGAVSLGLAAKLCGVPQAEFMQFAAEREVALRYSLEDLEQDRQFIADFRSHITLVNYTHFSPTLALVSNPCYKY